MSKNFEIEVDCPRCKERIEITADSSMLNAYKSIHKRCPKCRLGLVIHISPGSEEYFLRWDAFRNA